MRRTFALFSLLICASQTGLAAQVRPRIGVNPAIRAINVSRPDVPLLLGLNSGHAAAVQNMDGGGGEQLANGFAIGPTSTAPRLGMMGPQRQLVSLVPGNMPMARVLLPEPGWNAFGVGALTGFTFDAHGRFLYGVNCQAGQVVRFDVQTREVATVGTQGTGVGQLECPEKIAVGADGRIYVADRNRVVRMNDITGNGWTAFGRHGSGAGEFNLIAGIAVDSRGRVYVSDFFNNRIVSFDDMNGAGWAEYRTGINEPAGIAVDHFDRVYLALPVAGKVIRLDDISGAGRKELYIPSVATLAGTRGPAIVVPLRPTPQGGVIR
jgi:hypothetical protein